MTASRNKILSKEEKDDLNGKVADIFRMQRKSRGFTRKEMSFRTGLSESYIVKLEEGRNESMKIDTLFSLCKASGVNFYDIVNLYESYYKTSKNVVEY